MCVSRNVSHACVERAWPGMLVAMRGTTPLSGIEGLGKEARASCMIRTTGNAEDITPGDRHVLITGGSGFIGTNVADRYLSQRHNVLLFDNMSRPGIERNYRWLKDKYGPRVKVQLADTRDRAALRQAVRHASHVFHFAAQVAVTTSLEDPMNDFLVNAGGTVNLLEELRNLNNPPPALFTSTNKVYGGLDDIA